MQGASRVLSNPPWSRSGRENTAAPQTAGMLIRKPKRTAKSFFVPKAENVDNGYDLSNNKYKKTEYKSVEYPPTSEILAELRRLEKEIGTAMDELEEMLK